MIRRRRGRGGREVRGRVDGFCSKSLFKVSRGFNAAEPSCSSRAVAAPNLAPAVVWAGRGMCFHAGDTPT